MAEETVFLQSFNGKFVITGDTHIHNFTQYSDKAPDVSSRLNATLDVLNQIHDYCVANQIYLIVVNGDIFETKSEVQCVVNNRFFDWCRKCDESGISVILNTGNHDIASLYDEKETLLHPYKALANVEVVEDFTIFNQSMFKGFCNMAVLPFRRDINTLKKWTEQARSLISKNENDEFNDGNRPLNFLFAHCSVLGATITNREFMDTKKAIYASDLNQEGFYDFTFLSHFHQKQEMAPAVKYVGSPLQHDMSDVNSEKGFYVMDCTTFKLKFVPTKYPTFNKIKLTSRDELDKVAILSPDDYYEIKVNTPDITRSDLIAFKNNHKVKIIWDVAIKIKTRIENITTKTDIKDVMADFIDLNNPDKLDKNTLLKKGLEYVAKAKGNVN